MLPGKFLRVWVYTCMLMSLRQNYLPVFLQDYPSCITFVGEYSQTLIL
jgi:hypothetical protein